MARRRLFDDEGKIIKMERVEEKETTTGRKRFFDEQGKTEFERGQEKVEEQKKSVDPFAGQTMRATTGKEIKEEKGLFGKASDFIGGLFGKKETEIQKTIKKTEEAKQEHWGRGEVSPLGKVERIGKMFAGGVTGTIEGTGRAFEWLGVDSLKPFNDKIEKWGQCVAVENPTFVEKVYSGVGSMSMFYAPGGIVGKGMQVIAKVSPKIASIFAGSTMTAFEAMTESGGVWKEAQDIGKSEEEADKIAEKVFWANSLLIGITNKLSYFSPKSKSLLKQILLKSAPPESLQEFGQTAISNVSLGKQWDEGAYEAGAIGFIIGGTFGINEITPENRDYAEKVIADKLQMTPEEAVNFVTVIQQFQEDEAGKITAIERQKEIDIVAKEKVEKESIQKTYSILEERALSIGFSSVKIQENPIIDKINNQNAPTGVFPGRELRVHLPTLKEDVKYLESGESMSVEIGGKTEIIKMEKNMTLDDVVDKYLDVLLRFEKKHLEQMTVEEAQKISEGRGAEVAKKMDERVVGKEDVGGFIGKELDAEVETIDTEDIKIGKNIKFTVNGVLVNTHIKEDDGVITLVNISTKKADKPSEDISGTGKGTEFINAFKKYADKSGKKIVIENPTKTALSYWRKFVWLKETETEFVYDPKKKEEKLEREVKKEEEEKPETSKKTKPQEAIREAEKKKPTETIKEALTKEEISDMKELKRRKDIMDKEIAEIEKDKVRVAAGKELAKKLKQEKERTKPKSGIFLEVVEKEKFKEFITKEEFMKGSGIRAIEEKGFESKQGLTYKLSKEELLSIDPETQSILIENKILNKKGEIVLTEKGEKLPDKIKNKLNKLGDEARKMFKEGKFEIAETKTGHRIEIDNGIFQDYFLLEKPSAYPIPIFSKSKIKELLKIDAEFAKNPTFTVKMENKKKVLTYTGEKTTFSIVASAIGLNEENLKVGDIITIDKEKFLKAGGTQEIRAIEYDKKGVGSAYASIGVFADGTPIKTGSLKEILPIQFPDLIYLARQVGSTVEINRRLRTSRGMFKGGDIQLHKDLFSNTEQAAKTLAHEIGHLTDWLPDKAMDRGNILGRIYTLRNFLKNTYGKTEITNKEFKEELWKLSQYWRPLGEINTDGYMKYRKSSVELYADALSVLLNSPGLLEEKAPNFYKSFFENLDRKPVVFEEYFSLQEELRMGSNELTKKWRKRIGGTKGMYEKANYKAIEIQKHKEDEIKKERSIGQLWAQTKRGVYTLHSDYETKIKEVKKRGGVVNDNENPVYYLNERNYVGSKIKAVIERHLLPALEEIKKNGITQEELGEVLFYERILKGDRGEVANPGGFQKEFIEEMMGESVDPKTREIKQNEGSLRKELGEEKFAILKEQAKIFRSGLKEIFKMGYREGIYNDELYKLMQENEFYVPFKTQKYMDQKTKASVSRKVGTLSDIENPINTSIEKAMAIVRSIENNKAKKVGISFLQKEFSEDIEKAKTRFVNDRSEVIEIRDKTVSYMKDGKPVGFYVPKYIADSLNNRSTEEIKVITHTLGRLNRKWFKPVFVGINTGFHIANFSRDFFRFWKNIPKMSFVKSFKLYYQAYPHARKKAKAEEDILVTEMEEGGILGLTLNDYMAGATEEDVQNDIILQRIGLAQEEKSFFGERKVLKPIAFVLDKIREMGDIIEALPKIAGYIHFKGDEAGAKISMKEKDFIRRFVGSPDFFAKGSWTKNSNDVFLFSNAIIQGVRSDYEVATNPETRSEFWWKTSKTVFVPKMLMAAATMGMLGEYLKEVMDEATEYDKTNYIIIPIGKDENKKAVYFRLPQDETSRFLGGMFWKAQRFLTTGELESMQDIISLWSGQIPAITPAITLPNDLFQFATGKNVYDTFRQRTVLTDDQATAGWKYKAKPVATYVWNQAGGNIFLKLYSGESTEIMSPKENFLRLPIVSNVIGRFFKVTDYGKVEILRREVSDPIRKEVAEKRMEDKKLINEYVKKVRESSGFFERRKLERELAETIIGHKPKGSEEISEAKRIIKKLDIAVIKGQSDETVNSLIYAVTNKEKIELLNRYKESMSETEFKNLRMLLLKHKIVSRDVFSQLNK